MENYTAALTKSESADYAGQYYTRVGVAVIPQAHDGLYFRAGFVWIP